LGGLAASLAAFYKGGLRPGAEGPRPATRPARFPEARPGGLFK